MPVAPDLTVDDVIRHIVIVATAPRRVREAGLVEDSEKQRQHEVDARNFGVYVLRSIGLTLDEIRALYERKP